MKIRVCIAAAVLAAGIAGAGLPADSQIQSSIPNPVENREFYFYFDTPGDVLSATHGGNIPVPLTPPGMKSLAGTAAASIFDITVLLREQSGKVVGVATEVEDQTAPLSDHRPWDTIWLLTLAGRGSIYIYQNEAFPMELGKLFDDVKKSGRTWVGNFDIITTTIGPRSDKAGVIMGGTGEFSGAQGSVIEGLQMQYIDKSNVTKGRSYIKLKLFYPTMRR